jgi:hypothetical protein
MRKGGGNSGSAPIPIREPMSERVTFDTNVFPAGELISRARQLGMSVAAVTVTHREAEGCSFEYELRDLETVIETGGWNESRWNQAVWGSLADGDCLDRALSILSNCSFPSATRTNKLSAGHRRQLRDGMILCAHLRSNRDIFVSDDSDFIADGRRELIEAEFATRVMTKQEFDAYLTDREAQTPGLDALRADRFHRS